MLDAWMSEPPDPGIVSLVNAINATRWMTTLESCAGHPGEVGRDFPYVVLWSAAWADVLAWVTRANRHRVAQPGAMFGDDVLIRATWDGELFTIYGQYISPSENERIILALLETLD